MQNCCRESTLQPLLNKLKLLFIIEFIYLFSFVSRQKNKFDGSFALNKYSPRGYAPTETFYRIESSCSRTCIYSSMFFKIKLSLFT